MNKKNKNILCVFKLPPPVNGATTANSYIFESTLLKNKFNIFYLNYGLSRANDDFGTVRFGKVTNYISCFMKCIFMLLSKQIDLCYITVAPRNFAFFKDSLFVCLFKFFKKKYIVHLHGKGIHEQVCSSNVWRLYYKFIFRKAYVICLTDRLVKDISSVYNSHKPFIIPNGISKFTFTKNNNGIKRELKILFLSNLYIKKGIFVFIEAIEELTRQTEICFEALIVGNSTKDISVNDLKKLINKQHMGEIIKVIGPLYGIDKERIFSGCDFFVFPTMYENETFGIVNLEAMTAGIPIISTKMGGIPDLVEDGVNGYLIEPNNSMQLAEKMRILLENKNLRETIGAENIKKFNENYTKSHFEMNIAKTFESILTKTTCNN